MAALIPKLLLEIRNEHELDKTETCNRSERKYDSTSLIPFTNSFLTLSVKQYYICHPECHL